MTDRRSRRPSILRREPARSFGSEHRHVHARHLARSGGHGKAEHNGQSTQSRSRSVAEKAAEAPPLRYIQQDVPDEGSHRFDRPEESRPAHLLLGMDATQAVHFVPETHVQPRDPPPRVEGMRDSLRGLKLHVDAAVPPARVQERPGAGAAEVTSIASDVKQRRVKTEIMAEESAGGPSARRPNDKAPRH